MKRIVIVFIFLVLAGGLVAALMARARAPEWLRQKILTSLTQSCPRCKAELESVDLSFWQGRVVLHDFEFVDDPEHETQVAVKAHLIEADFDPTAYRNGLILVRHVKGEGIDFVLTENPNVKSAPDDNSPPLSGLPPMVMEETEVSDSSFRYVHKISPEATSISLTKIHGTLGSWVTRPDLVEQYAPNRTAMAAWGVLERQGTFEIKSEIDALSQQGTLKINVTVQDMPLPAVGSFFLHESGMVLNGLVIKTSAYLDMKNGKIDGKLKAIYTGLKIKIENKKNSGIKNFIETIGADIVIAGERGVNGKPEGEKTFHSERKADQSLFSAIFRALGSAAKDLVR